MEIKISTFLLMRLLSRHSFSFVAKWAFEMPSTLD